MFLAGESHNPDGTQTDFPGCRMLGRLSRDQLARYYARAAVFAHPACYEPFGLCVLEAALSGCALVLGDVPSLREIWQDTAIFVPPGESGMLGTALRELAANPPLREEMALLSSHRARAFTAERMGSRYLDAYERIHKESYACAS